MIRLHTLGRLNLEQEGGSSAASALSQPKRLALLVYLAAVHPSATRSRDTLVALLWPELDDAHARTAVRQALLGLRRSLGAQVLTGKGEERVGVDPGRLWCDAAAFTAALAEGKHEAALALYGGPFLDGFHVSAAPEFERWVERERHRLALEAAAAAWRLVDAAESDGKGSLARHWAERALELAPYDEQGFRRYLRVLHREAGAPAAVTAYAAYEARLADDLGLEPSTETTALFQEIRSADVTLRAGGAPGPQAAAPTPTRAGVRPVGPQVPSPDPAHAAQALHSTAVKRLPRWARWATGAAALVALAGTLVTAGWLRSDVSGARPPRTAIAVLPFRNLSADSADAYFAAGLHDELLSQLSGVTALQLRGRTSVSGYRATSKPLQQVAEELHVGSIVEGSVQIVGDRLRVVVHLLDPVTQQNLLLRRYERTLDDAFAVQSEIAEQIVTSVGARLTAAERGAIRTAPTRDAAAYQLYLQAVEYSRRPGYLSENLLVAQRLYEKALELDSTFALAHAALSRTHWFIYMGHHDSAASRLVLMRQAAEAALRLDPDLPQGHLAKGLAYHVADGDYRAAQNEFMVALRGAPNDPELWGWVARMHRNLGNWDSARAAYERALTIDPRDANLHFSLATLFHYLHRYEAAIQTYRKALVLAPEFAQARIALAWSYVLWTGRMDTLRATLRDLPLDGDPGARGTPILDQRLALMFWSRQPDSMLALLAATRGAAATSGELLTRTTYAAHAHLLRGDRNAARAGFESVLQLLDSAVQASPGDWFLHGERGMALAALGRRAEALREARWLERSDAYRNDRFTDAWVMEVRALILARAGETDAAIAECERVLSRPSVATVHTMRLSPHLDPIRNDPRFQALLVKYAR